MPDEVDEGGGGGTSQRYGSIHDRADGGCQLSGGFRGAHPACVPLRTKISLIS